MFKHTHTHTLTLKHLHTPSHTHTLTHTLSHTHKDTYTHFSRSQQCNKDSSWVELLNIFFSYIWSFCKSVSIDHFSTSDFFSYRTEWVFLTEKLPFKKCRTSFAFALKWMSLFSILCLMMTFCRFDICLFVICLSMFCMYVCLFCL